MVTKAIDFDHEMLAYFIAVKRKEGWHINECAYAVDLVARGWELDQVVQLFGYMYRNYLILDPLDGEAKSMDGKWTAEELGRIIGLSMDAKDYSFIVDLLVKMVIGEGKHKTIFDDISRFCPS